MNPDPRRDALLERVEALSETQRRALGHALAERDRPDGRRELTAWVEPRDGGVDDQALRDFLGERLPEHMIPVRYVAVDRIPRTRAGKLDRRAVAFVPGSGIGAGPGVVVGPRNDAEETLARIWRDVLGVDEISVHDDFFEMGGDSLLSIRVISRAGREGIPISPQSFFESPTIAHLAAAAAAARAPVDQGPVAGIVHLTPIQHWFFERITRQPHHWNQAVLIKAPRDVEPERIRQALRELLAHHDALRARFVRTDGDWLQEFAPVSDDLAFRTVEMVAVPESERVARIEGEADAEHASLDLEEGRLFRAVLFDGGPDFRRLLLVAHHLVIDSLSWGFVLEDLSTLVARGAGASRRDLPPKTTSLPAWGEALREAAQDLGAAELRLWTSGPDARLVADLQAGEGPRPDGVSGSGTGRLRVELDRETTAHLLGGVSPHAGGSVQELILAAVLLGWCRWSGRPGLQVDVEGHGRDVLASEVDVSRTVGWFTTVFPLALVPSEVSAPACVRAVREAFQALPMRGASHGFLRYLHRDPEVRRSVAQWGRSEALFNYLGGSGPQLPPDSPFDWAPEPTGRARPTDSRPAYSVETTVSLEGESLVLEVYHDRAVYGAAGDLTEALRAAALEVADLGSGSVTPFDLSGLDAVGLQRVGELLAEIDEGQA